jgi:hypothetical protein
MTEPPRTEVKAELVVHELVVQLSDRSVELAIARARIRELEAQMDAR